MQTIILAGGMGTRLKKTVSDVPKPMAPVGGKPFLEYIIADLAAQGLGDIMLSVGYGREVIKSYFEDGSRWKVRIAYSEETTPLGTGGALAHALEAAGGGDCLVLNGDTFNKMSFRDIIDFHNSKDALMTMGLTRVDNADRYGSVELADSGEIVGFLEKPSRDRGYINRGVYVTSGAILPGMPPGPFSLEKDFFPGLIGLKFYGFPTDGFFTDIGIPSTYRYMDEHAYLLEQTEESSRGRR
jgi:D-glycero-alpha-D-manno-heptose 1-phosphate guanylyltransferase